MKAKKRKRRERAWADFQAVHGVSDDAMALIRKVHGRVAELMRSFPDPPPDSIEDWLRERYRQWTKQRAHAAEQPRPSAPKEKKRKKFVYDLEWAKAKKLCRLNQRDIEMAKRLGFRPKSLMKNRPSPSQRWKASVKDWIRGLYAKRFVQESAGLSRADAKEALATVTGIQRPPLDEIVDEATDETVPF